MVHQRTNPLRQTTARDGLERCSNCGYGLGQFGVEFTRDHSSYFCSLDCFTSAKVTAEAVPRDSRYRRRRKHQAPWLLVEAPPSPMPWRGRYWSNNRSPASVTANLTGKDFLYFANWRERDGDRLGDGMGVGMGLSALDGTAAEIEAITKVNSARRLSNGAGSGGSRALHNSESGGAHVDDVCYDECRIGRKKIGIGRTTACPVASRSEAVGTSSAVKDNFQGKAGFEDDLSPLALIPRARALPQPRGVINGVDGYRKVKEGNMACAGLPFGDASPKMDADAPGRVPKPRAENIPYSGGVSRWDDGGDSRRSVACQGSDVPRQSVVTVGATPVSGERRLFREGGSHDIASPATYEAGPDVESVAVKDVHVVSAAVEKKNANGEAEINLLDKEVQWPEAGRCGVEASPELDAAAAERIGACDPVRAQPTRVAIRQWRHMFFS